MSTLVTLRPKEDMAVYAILNQLNRALQILKTSVPGLKWLPNLLDFDELDAGEGGIVTSQYLYFPGLPSSDDMYDSSIWIGNTNIEEFWEPDHMIVKLRGDQFGALPGNLGAVELGFYILSPLDGFRLVPVPGRCGGALIENILAVRL